MHLAGKLLPVVLVRYWIDSISVALSLALSKFMGLSLGNLIIHVIVGKILNARPLVVSVTSVSY